MRAGEKYRQKAQLLLAQAELIREPAQRSDVLRIAGSYLKLAEHIGKRKDRAMEPRDRERRALSGR